MTASVEQQRKLVTAIPGPKSQALMARRNAVVSAGVGTSLGVFIERAHGAVIVDVDGNQLLDFGGGIGVTTVGHTDDAVVTAAKEQLDRVTHTLFTVTPYEEYVRVCELLAKHTPGDFAKKSVLVNSGSEAVENGVKIARKYTGRRAIAVLEHGYHGRTNLTMTMNFKPFPYATGMGPLASDIFHAPNSYPFRDGLTGEEAAARTILYLEKHVGAVDLAALVAEPIQGEGGFMVAAEGYFTKLQEWCTANGVVMIADEVQSGIARSGHFYASEIHGWVPDLVLTAKGIAGGLPIAAVTGRAEIMDSVHAGGLGGTFSGNPISCAAAIAVLESLEDGSRLKEAQRIEKTLVGGLTKLQAKHPVIGDIRGRGAMIAIEFVVPGTAETSKTPETDVVAFVVNYAAQQGVLLLNAGTYGNVVRFLPSLAMTDALIEDALGVLDEALTAYASK
ncbi:MAG: aminotransferase class III-fold pyridoxal phosphate-dependent enzyme [Microbacteriaceae bacterium]